MKFKKTSSTINQKDLSLNFNISEISTILKETTLNDWDLFLTCNTICYVVQDASLSEYQGLKNVFPEACVLMCYFHVTSNVIKNYCKYNVPLESETI
jgi:hypothetical protein